MPTESTYTIEQYLNGKVRNVSVPDNAISAIIMDAGVKPRQVEKEVVDVETGESSTQLVEEPVTKDSDVSVLSERERELCLAWLYVWVAGSPTQSGGFTEKDADWQSSENGERMSANVLKNYLAMANLIFKKYGLETIRTGKWGVAGHGFRNVRRYDKT